MVLKTIVSHMKFGSRFFFNLALGCLDQGIWMKNINQSSNLTLYSDRKSEIIRAVKWTSVCLRNPYMPTNFFVHIKRTSGC